MHKGTKKLYTLTKESGNVFFTNFWVILGYILFNLSWLIPSIIILFILFSSIFGYSLQIISNNYIKITSTIFIYTLLLIFISIFVNLFSNSIVNLWKKLIDKDKHKIEIVKMTFSSIKEIVSISKITLLKIAYFLVFLIPVVVLIVLGTIYTGDMNILKSMNFEEVMNNTNSNTTVEIIINALGYGKYFIILFFAIYIYVSIRTIFFINYFVYHKEKSINIIKKSLEIVDGSIYYIFNLGLKLFFITMIIQFIITILNPNTVGVVASSLIEGFSIVLLVVIEILKSIGKNIVFEDLK